MIEEEGMKRRRRLVEDQGSGGGGRWKSSICRCGSIDCCSNSSSH